MTRTVRFGSLFRGDKETVVLVPQTVMKMLLLSLHNSLIFDASRCDGRYRALEFRDVGF